MSAWWVWRKRRPVFGQYEQSEWRYRYVLWLNQRPRKPLPSRPR